MDEYLGVVKMFVGNPRYRPGQYLPCDGRVMQVPENQALFALLGNYYGGDGRMTFALPDMREKDKEGRPIPFMPGKPMWMICVQGVFPSNDD
jgi:microcystin-dependent protein